MSKLHLYRARNAALDLSSAVMGEIASECDFMRAAYREDATLRLRETASALGYDLVERKSDEAAA